jgi:hypothetical protein
MIVLRATLSRLPFGLPTLRIAKANITCCIWRSFSGRYRPMTMSGFNQLYEDGRIEQPAYWTHVRHHFYNLEQAHSSPVARQAMQRIGALYGIEEEIRGKPLDQLRGIACAGRSVCSRDGMPGGERAAASYSLISSVKLNGLDPYAYLRQVLIRIADREVEVVEGVLGVAELGLLFPGLP